MSKPIERMDSFVNLRIFDFVFHGFKDGMGRYYHSLDCALAFRKFLFKQLAKAHFRKEKFNDSIDWGQKIEKLKLLATEVTEYISEYYDVSPTEREATETSSFRIYRVVEIESKLREPNLAF
ncbi:MAG: hypothetical protein ABEJ02_00520 [Candidatus Paceibacteria bacterium]